MPITAYSATAELEAETARLQAEAVRARKYATGQQILYAFFKNHPEYQSCQASTVVIERYIHSQGAGEFTLKTLEDGVASFGPELARSAAITPRETPTFVLPGPRTDRLVPFTKRDLLRMSSTSLRELINRSEDHNREVNRILNAKETQ